MPAQAGIFVSGERRRDRAGKRSHQRFFQRTARPRRPRPAGDGGHVRTPGRADDVSFATRLQRSLVNPPGLETASEIAPYDEATLLGGASTDVGDVS